MSQSGKYSPTIPRGTYVETLTGNAGGAVGANGSGNINIVGDGVLTTVNGNPGTNTLTITLTGAVADEYATNSGTAVPALGVLNIVGGATGLTFSGAGNTVTLGGTLDVDNGGTGNNAMVAYAPIVGGTTTTNPFQSANTGIGTAGFVLTSTGAASVPTWQATAVTGIVTINGNSGSATGATVTVKVNQASLPAYTGGSTVNFYASGATDQLSFTDNLDNTGVGYLSLASLAGAGGSNTAFGFSSLNAVTSGDNNTGIGTAVGQVLTTGSSNTFLGYTAGLVTTSGDANTLLGVAAANRLTTGQYNIILGAATSGASPFTSASGYNYTSSESSNILIGNLGVTAESNVIRIGTSGSSAGQQNKCYVAGIDGVNVGSVAKVVTMASDQLGTATITAGAGITVTPSANTITIASIGSGLTWSVITANQTAAVENGYFCNKAGTLALALPASSSVGDVIEVTNENTALGVQFTQAAGQQILIGNTNTTLGATGTLTSSAVGDTLKIVCKVANTIWRTIDVIGNWSPV